MLFPRRPRSLPRFVPCAPQSIHSSQQQHGKLDNGVELRQTWHDFFADGAAHNEERDLEGVRRSPDLVITLDGRRLIQQHPIQPQLPNGFGELLKVHGLDDIAVDPQPVAFRDVPLFARRSQDDHRQGVRRSVLMRRSTSSPFTLGSLRSSRMTLG